jgi:hypothetical protein
MKKEERRERGEGVLRKEWREREREWEEHIIRERERADHICTLCTCSHVRVFTLFSHLPCYMHTYTIFYTHTQAHMHKTHT